MRRVAVGGLALSIGVLVAVPVVAGSTAPERGTPTSAGVPAAPSSPASPSPAPVPATPVPSPPADSPGVQPIGLQVPRLGIDAEVLATGVAEDGQAEIPEDIQRVGWYRFGPGAAAAAGSTVIVGHVDSFDQGRGALFPLRDAQQGDVITLRLTDGRPADYQVVEVTRLDKAGLPTAELFRRDGPPVLTVITCGGPYNRSLGGYQQNLVVTAIPLGAQA